MPLLFLTPQPPHPPRQGTAIRNWGLIKSLSARHPIDLLTFAGPGDAITPALQDACRQVETVPVPARRPAARLRDLLLSAHPDLAHRLWSTAFEARVRARVEAMRYEAVFVEGLELARVLPALQGRASRLIFDAHNCETLLQQRAFATDRRTPGRWPAALYSLIQSHRLARFEADACRRVDRVTCVSAEDAAALRRLAPEVQPAVVPNGLFLSEYAAAPPPPAGRPQLVFTGKMDYRPNVDAVTWFADEILPRVQRDVPQAEFVVVGQKPVGAVQRLARQRGVRVTGAVEDVRTHIAGAAVYVAPLRMGGGTRFKLLEAMALRRPIVSTPLGAEGFAVQDGRELLLAESAGAFADAAIALLRDPLRAHALGLAGYEFVRRYDWGRIVPEMEAVIASGG